jgi:DNA-binding NtrC family response regulator
MEDKKRILLIEDDAPLRESIRQFLEKSGYRADESGSLAEAARRLGQAAYDLLLLDLTLPDGSGLDILERFGRQYQHRVLVLSGTGSIASAVQAMKQGAHDFLQKPLNPDLLLLALQRTFAYLQEQRDCRELKSEMGSGAGFDKFIFRSEAMAATLALARRYAATAHTVLISGETGTGKELMAQAIHAASGRSQRPLVSVNCASIPENLAESELFGYKKGAFTGAYADSPGKFQLADRGTILLDEIGELPLPLQAKLLRVLENGEITPLKSKSAVRVDIRVLAASNKDLEEEVQHGRFRADLFYRIDELKVHIPPLRERRADIGPLADHFLGIANLVNARGSDSLSAAARALLNAYDWPGNVRELKNTIFKIAASGLTGQILPQHLPLKFSHPRTPAAAQRREPSLAEIEKGHIQRVLQQSGFNYTRAAAILRISRSSLYRKLDELRMRRK